MFKLNLCLFTILAIGTLVLSNTTDICDLCHCDFLDQKNSSPHTIICNCQKQHTEIHFRPKAPRMINVTAIAIMDCAIVVFHDYAFATTSSFNLHVTNVGTLEFKANAMIGANIQNAVLKNINNLILEPSSVRQGSYDFISVDCVTIPNLPNIANSEMIKINHELSVINVTIGLMHTNAVKTDLTRPNSSIKIENVTVEKLLSTAANLAASTVKIQGTRFGATLAGFTIQGREKVTIAESYITRETHTDIMNILSPFINMSANTFIFSLPFHGDTVKPSGKYAKFIFNGNKIHDVTYFVV